MKKSPFLKRAAALLMSAAMLGTFPMPIVSAKSEQVRVMAKPTNYVYNASEFSDGRTPDMAFDEDSGKWKPASTMEWRSAGSAASVTVDCAETITFSKISLPVRIGTKAYNATTDTLSAADAKLTLKVTAYGDDGSVISEQTETSTLLAGSKITYKTDGGNAMWGRLPDMDFEEITAKK